MSQRNTRGRVTPSGRDKPIYAAAVLAHADQGALGDPASGTRVTATLDSSRATGDYRGDVINGRVNAITGNNPGDGQRVNPDPNAADQENQSERGTPYTVDPSLEQMAASFSHPREKPNEAFKMGLAHSATDDMYNRTANRTRLKDTGVAQQFGTASDDSWFEQGDEPEEAAPVSPCEAMPGSSAAFIVERQDNPCLTDLENIPVRNPLARVQLLDPVTFNRYYRNLVQIPAGMRHMLH